MELGAKSVLVVDDDPSILELMARCLAQQGCEALVARDGAEALRIAERYPEPIELLVTDIMMPHVDGFMLVPQVAQRHPDIKVLFVSGYADTSPEIRHGLQGSGRFYMKKPFRPVEFLLLIDIALERRVSSADAVSLILSDPVLQPMPDAGWRSRSPRYRLDVPARFRLPDSEGWERGTLRDLSRKGMRIDTDLRLDHRPLLAARRPVNVRVSLPRRQGRAVEVWFRGAPVRTTRPQGLAIEIEGSGVEVSPVASSEQQITLAASREPSLEK